MNWPKFWFSLLFFLLTTAIFFNPFFLQGKLPIPSDTIIGLYHPYRDLYSKDYPNGIPYKNFLITDPVRQQYPWRLLAIEIEKTGELPLWNPYSMAGTPLVGSIQSAAFYPLNILFFILPFSFAWSLLVILQPLLAGIFMFLYLRNLKLVPLANILGGITFAFCGFSIAWLEWNTLVQTALWLPLVLLCIDKLESRIRNQESRKETIFLWFSILLFALVSSFFAGHLQTFFYLALFSIVYFLTRWIQFGKSKKLFLSFLLLTSCFLLLTFLQWFPALQFILQSARDVDQNIWQQEGWFIPWHHLIQFVAPDFFGNPATLNYWGTWNYAELVGYVGIVPLVFAFLGLFYRRDKKTLFFGIIFLASLLFALPTFLAKIPFLLNIPFISTSQPTRLLFLTDFSLAVLAAFGLDFYLKQQKRKVIFLPLAILLIIFIGLWLFVFQGSGEHFQTAKRNLYLPTLIFISTFLLVLAASLFKNKRIIVGMISVLVLITVFDLLRFGQKFIPFTNEAYLFPSTKIMTFLQNDKGQFRIISTDNRILPPNFSSVYRIETVDGYDPLYLMRYGELIAASERGKPDINPPFGFNRIIAPTNVNSRIIDLLGVKYVLSFEELSSPKFTKIMEEGQTKLYKNNEAFPRVFFVANIKQVKTKQEAVTALFDPSINLRNTALSSLPVGSSGFGQGQAKIAYYSPNKVIVDTENKSTGFLVLTDTFYPTWKAKVCSRDHLNCTVLPIFLVDYHFRGVMLPEGNHSVIFYNTLL